MTLAIATEKKHAARGVAILSLTTFLWGTTFVVTKNTLTNFPASELILLRFLVAGVVFLPFLRLGRKLWLAAIELGLLLWAGFATQTVGLRYTTCDRSAFLTSLHVVFVPALAGLLGRSTRLVVWVAAIIALLGVGLLSHDGLSPNRGDVWTIACALVWAIYITRLETLTIKLSSRALTAAHLWVVVILSVGWTALDHPARGPIPWISVIYLGLFATAATTWFQTLGQKWVTAPQAAVLYTMEPMWAAMFSWIFMGETLGAAGKIGGALILAAAVLTQWPSRNSKNEIRTPAVSMTNQERTTEDEDRNKTQTASDG